MVDGTSRTSFGGFCVCLGFFFWSVLQIEMDKQTARRRWWWPQTIHHRRVWSRCGRSATSFNPHRVLYSLSAWEGVAVLYPSAVDYFLLKKTRRKKVFDKHFAFIVCRQGLGFFFFFFGWRSFVLLLNSIRWVVSMFKFCGERKKKVFSAQKGCWFDLFNSKCLAAPRATSRSFLSLYRFFFCKTWNGKRYRLYLKT